MAKEVRTRQVRRDIKALDKTAAAAGHMKHAYVRTKDSAGKERQEHATPVEYAEDKVNHGMDRAAHKAVCQVQKQDGKAVNRVKEKYQTVKTAGQIKQELREGHSSSSGECPSFSLQGEEKACQPKEQMVKNTRAKAGNQEAQRRAGQGEAQQKAVQRKAQQKAAQKSVKGMRELPKQDIKTIDRGKKTIKTVNATVQNVKATGRGAVKSAGKSVKTAGQTAKTTVKTSRQAAKAAQKAAKASAKAAEKSVRVTRQAAKAAGQTAKATVKTAATAVKAAIAAANALISAIAAGGWIVVLILFIVILFGAVLGIVGGSNSGTVSPVSAEVEAYEPAVRKYADQYGIGEYAELIKAVMMQESGGKGNDPMQSSQCSYNKKFPRKPNGITDPGYSIECGVQALRAALEEAETESPIDMEHIKLALQGYNYGNGYISWAKSRDGGYTAANAIGFSDMMAEKMGWGSYGDKQYVPHVLRYYAFGRIPAGTGNQAIVQVALAQEGNSGDAYWSWYGFGSRVEWCACFVSWCAEQCGYLENGVMPKFSLCSDGAEWFIAKGQFRDGSYVPAAGDVIFFAWGNDGSINHVGIVESVSDGAVHTVEGNSRDKVARRSYPIGSDRIFGYGVPLY